MVIESDVMHGVIVLRDLSCKVIRCMPDRSIVFLIVAIGITYLMIFHVI